MAEGEAKFACAPDRIDMAKLDGASFTLEKLSDEDFDIELRLPDNIKLENTPVFSGNSARVDITSGSGGGDEDRIYVIYKDKTTGKTAACDSINIVCSDSASFSLLPRYIDSRRWQNELRIYNERSQSPISGTVTFTSPDFLAERAGTVRFENIPSHGSKAIRTSIPEDMFKEKITASAIVELDSGERFEVANDYYCSGLARCENPPEIDGVLSPDEWQTFAPLELKYAQQVQMMTDWGGTEEMCIRDRILTVFLALLFGWQTPLLAIQLLWVNLVTDSLPAIALGVDPPDKYLMKEPPRPAGKSLFADGLWVTIMLEGAMRCV